MPSLGARALVVLLAVAAVVAAGLGAWIALVPAEHDAACGLLVEGVRLEPGDDPTRVIRGLGERWADEEVWLEAGPLTERLRRAEVGLGIDADACASAVHARHRSQR